MEINLGNKIKDLRKERGISQDVLAQVLGVTFQAVSKWETGAAMPDVTLIPAIASFFGVSTDELFDFNRMEQEQRVADICYAAAEIRREKPEEAEEMLRQGLKQFPGNEIILNNLLYTMRTPERSEEIVTLCKAILEVTKLDEVKYDVLRILAETYHKMGEQAMVKPTLQQIPEIYFTKLELDAQLLDSEEAYPSADAQYSLSRDSMLKMLAIMCQLKRNQGQMAVAGEIESLVHKLYHFFAELPSEFSFSENHAAWMEQEIWARLK